MNEINNYPRIPTPEPTKTTVEKSVERDGAFSKPGHSSKTAAKGKGWSPAKGTRFRSTIEKVKGRKRKRARDSRSVEFF